jgi:hypothetical protein
MTIVVIAPLQFVLIHCLLQYLPPYPRTGISSYTIPPI